MKRTNKKIKNKIIKKGVVKKKAFKKSDIEKKCDLILKKLVLLMEVIFDYGIPNRNVQDLEAERLIRIEDYLLKLLNLIDTPNKIPQEPEDIEEPKEAA